MTALRSGPHDPAARLAVVKQLAHYLRQYPYDIVDAKRLLRHFQVSTPEFLQALVRSQQVEDTFTPSLSSTVRPAVVSHIVEHLHQYPYDIVDIKRSLQHAQASVQELSQALLQLESPELEDTVLGDRISVRTA
jgi:hypothetical protein